MTQKEFLINFLCFVDKQYLKNDADMVDAYLAQHHKEYFEVEHIRKDASEEECSEYMTDMILKMGREN